MNQVPVLVFNACDKDIVAGMAMLEWCFELDGSQSYDVIIGRDQSVNNFLFNQFLALARRAFGGVSVYTYTRPARVTWPYIGNAVWQNAARLMREENRPWFWMENDCVPVKPKWIPVLFGEYERAVAAGRPIMGPQIPGPGYVNGVAFYPSNTPELVPLCMEADEIPWDYETRNYPNLLWDCPKIQQVWRIENNRPSFTSGGDAPSFKTQQNVDDWLDPNVYLFHRVKDGSLIHRLRERRNATLKLALPEAGGGGAVLRF